MKIYRYILNIGLVLIPLLVSAESAWALQSHGAPEGIYVHQLAHILFSAGLAYLFWHTRKTQEVTSKGWIFLQVFCVILIFWNILAFSGHAAFEHLSYADYINKNTLGERLAGPITFIKGLYYITKMDHFLMVPALFALVVSLRSFYLQAIREGK